MGKMILGMSMSLDGFVKASNATPEQPLGDGGELLHEWAFGEDERDREVLACGVEDSGAIIAGRRTYDDSVRFWGADGPHPPTEPRSDERLGPPTARGGVDEDLALRSPRDRSRAVARVL